MREENAIEVKDLKKQFKVYYDKGSQLKEKMLFWKRNRYENRQVLNGISFEVKKGEAVGLQLDAGDHNGRGHQLAKSGHHDAAVAGLGHQTVAQAVGAQYGHGHPGELCQVFGHYAAR